VWLVTEQNLTVGTVILVVLYLQQLQGPVQSLLGARYPRMRAGIALDRVEAVLATNPGNPAPTDSAATDPYTGSPSAPALWIAGVRYRYPAVSSYSIEGLSHAGDALSIAWLPMTGLSGDDRPADDAGRSGPAGGNALDDLDLSIGRGEFVAVVGPSGAGKSTLAGIASGLVEPDEGVVQVGDFTVAHLDETRRATLVAYIPQEPYVLHASVRDNLRYARPDATTPR
jgi:ATP-binding cassette subfamily B protein